MLNHDYEVDPPRSLTEENHPVKKAVKQHYFYTGEYTSEVIVRLMVQMYDEIEELKKK